LFIEHDAGGVWRILSKTRGKLQPGETVTLVDRSHRDVERLVLLQRLDDGLWAARPETARDPWELLDQVGRVPLPPYIRDGEMVEADQQSYQTVFAEHPGAVAAPTAGLHFTAPLLERLAGQGVEMLRVTLHVGLGTFRPISTPRLDQHTMHREWCRLTAETADRLSQIRRQGGRAIAVGTTVVRTLETAASNGQLAAWQGETDIFIRPPYTFQAIDALMTNFHLPKSTLLVLVRAFGGAELIRRAYAEAIRERYRFYSYGDAMLIL
jgi:S-adenosylmethionine:tRNA ribosyltransferase-isomerase